MVDSLRVLIVEDSEDDVILLVRELRKAGLQPNYRQVENAAAMEEALTQNWDLIICDYSLPRFSGLAALRMLNASGKDIPFIILSGAIGENIAVEAMKSGAHDYIMKANRARLIPAVKRELKDAQERRQRRSAEKALLESAARAQAIMNNVADVIFTVDTNGIIHDCNPTATKAFGYEQAALQNRCISTLFTETHGNNILAYLRAFPNLSTHKTVDQREVMEGVDRAGNVFPFEMAITTLQEKPKPFLIVTGHDISKRRDNEEQLRHLEMQLRQSQKMEAIGTLAGGIAHDFNNLLFAIMTYAKLGLKKTPEQERLHHHFGQILKASERARDLVQQILTFSRRDEQPFRLITVEPLVREALKFLRASLPANIEIVEKMQDGRFTMNGDPTQIHQIIVNLCVNAGYAMKNTGGRLTIRLRTCSAPDPKPLTHEHPPGNYLKLSIKDTGCGISADILERIFDPFFTTKPVGEGTGMGLAVVHGIVKRHQGYIQVKSEQGKGSRFDIYFPAVEKEDTHQTVQTPTAQPGEGRILVVDDERIIVESLAEMLTDLGYQVTTCLTSSDALRVFEAESNRFDLVLADQTMLGMTGTQLINKILTIRPETPAILMTGFSEFVGEDRAKHLGFKDFLLKPVTEEQLSATIKRVIGLHT